jgi:uroporphyrinogen-III synthase
LLIIRGDKSTNELQDGLKKAKRTFVETTVYSTSCRQSLKSDVRSLVEDIRDKTGKPWLAFFSPSSAEMVLDHFPSSRNSSSNEYLAKCKIATIGETTTQFLVQYGMDVHAVAKEPTAEGLVSAIRAYEEGLGKGDAVG